MWSDFVTPNNREHAENLWLTLRLKTRGMELDNDEVLLNVISYSLYDKWQHTAQWQARERVPNLRVIQWLIRWCDPDSVCAQMKIFALGDHLDCLRTCLDYISTCAPSTWSVWIQRSLLNSYALSLVRGKAEAARLIRVLAGDLIFNSVVWGEAGVSLEVGRILRRHAEMRGHLVADTT